MSSHVVATLHRRSTLRLGVGGFVAMPMLCGRSPVGSASRSPQETNKALVRRVFADVVNDGNVALLADLYAPVLLDPASTARRFPQLAGMPVPLDEFRALGSDIVATIEEMIAEGDLVATRVAWRGAHPPAGTHIEGQTMHLSRIVDARIVEEWSAGWDWFDPFVARSQP